MSEITFGVLKFAVSFFRTSAAKKLRDGDLTDEKVRGVIVQKLDNIELKLDGSTRKDLRASESCLRQGIRHLIMSLDEPVKSESPSTSELRKYQNQSHDTFTTGLEETLSKTIKLTQTFTKDVFPLAEFVQKSDAVSEVRLKLAKKHLEEAEKTARLAFHNTGLKMEDRILASEIRIASGILNLLHDRELAVCDSLQYLKELHEMPAIKEIFSVENKFGIKSWLKSTFNKESRAEIVERITMMNMIVAGFISKFTKRRMAVLDWPMIKSGTRLVHPIHSACDLPDLTRKLDVTPPWDIENNDLDENKALPFTYLLKSEDEFFTRFNRHNLGRQIPLDKTTGELQPYCRTKYHSDSEKDYDKNFVAGSLIIDATVHDDGTAYVLSKKSVCMLSTYSAEHIQHVPLEYEKESFLNSNCAIAVTKDKHIVIFQECIVSKVFKIFLCSDSGELINSFETRLTSETDYNLQFVSVSCDDEIIVATKKCDEFSKDSFVAGIFRENGLTQRTVKFRTSLRGVTHNKVTKSFIVFGTEIESENVFLEYFCDQTGELQRSYVLHQTNMPNEMDSFYPVCHPNSALSLVKKEPKIPWKYTPIGHSHISPHFVARGEYDA